uniref:Uncharacterized protein n=1 Tax=Anguilla anguilla TaxID=7936 RepID=A0A0E9W5C3_ANGAN
MCLYHFIGRSRINSTRRTEHNWKAHMVLFTQSPPDCIVSIICQHTQD